jgi:hypothetical protein
MIMGRKALALYVSANSMIAVARASMLTPLVATHAGISSIDWRAWGAGLREHFGVATVQLLLSARQCHYQVLPWLSSCYTGATIRRHVEDAFMATAGVDADSHRIEIDWPAYGEAVRAAAYPRAVVASLQEGLVASGHVLAGVDSSIGPILRRYGKAVEVGHALLAYGEDDGITGITLEHGKVVQIDTLSGSGTGLDDVGVWSSRKQFAFADDAQLHWLATTPQPVSYAGMQLPVTGSVPASAGHAVVMAWQ